MPVCSCGEPANQSGERCDRCEALHVLGLEHGATIDEIRAAHLALVTVWHPNSFDDQLRKVAEENLKAINSAFAYLLQSAVLPSGTSAQVTLAATPEQPASPTALPESTATKGIQVLLLAWFAFFGVLLLAALLVRHIYLGRNQPETAGTVTSSPVVSATSIKTAVPASTSSAKAAGGFAVESRQHLSKQPVAANATPLDIVAVNPLPSRMILSDRTPVRLKMPYPVSLSASQIGQSIEWEVAQDVLVNGFVVIPRNAKAIAKVSTVFRAGGTARLSMAISHVTSPTGLFIPLQATVDHSQILNFSPERLTDDEVVQQGQQVVVYVHGDIPVTALASTQAKAASDNTGKLSIPDGTPVRLLLAKDLSSDTAAIGDHVGFEAAENVVVDDTLVAIRKGTVAWGTVTQSIAGNSAGRTGKLAVTLDFIRLTDGSTARLRGAQASTAAVAAGRVATVEKKMGAFVLGAERANNTMIPQGTVITAFVDGGAQGGPSAAPALNAR